MMSWNTIFNVTVVLAFVYMVITVLGSTLLAIRNVSPLLHVCALPCVPSNIGCLRLQGGNPASGNLRSECRSGDLHTLGRQLPFSQQCAAVHHSDYKSLI